VGGAEPEGVVAPGTEAEVRAVLEIAGASGVGVVPVGGGTDLGPEAPTGPFMVLSTARMEGVEDYEPADMTVTARGGTRLSDLSGVLGARGQWLPVDPPFAPDRTVGGLVATGAAGPLGMAYGAPRDHVLGLSLMTGDRRVLRLGGRVMKNVAGFDLVKLVVGSRGTLGVVLSATFRLFPRPAVERLAVVDGEGPGALTAVARVVATAPVVPASAVMVAPGLDGGGASLVVRVQGALAAVAADTQALLGDALANARVLDGAEAHARLGAVRDHAARHPLVLRAFVAPASIHEAVAALQDALPVEALAAEVLSGRVRVGTSEDGRTAAAVERVRTRLADLGGTLVVERGSPGLVAQVPPYPPGGRSAALEAALRRRFDPGGVLSQGRFLT
jgi:glycolate oxidase FAD binding subunit